MSPTPDDQRIQLIVLLIAAAVIFFARQVRDHGGVMNALSAVTKGCDYERPGLWRQGPYAPASRYCGSSRDLQDLMNHMRVHCAEMEACAAGEFGSNVAVWYFSVHDVFLVNPVVAEDTTGATMIACKRGTGESVYVPSPVTVSYLDEDLRTATRSFYNRGACFVHAMRAETRGVSFL